MYNIYIPPCHKRKLLNDYQEIALSKIVDRQMEGQKGKYMHTYVHTGVATCKSAHTSTASMEKRPSRTARSWRGTCEYAHHGRTAEQQ